MAWSVGDHRPFGRATVFDELRQVGAAGVIEAALPALDAGPLVWLRRAFVSAAHVGEVPEPVDDVGEEQRLM